MRKDQELLTATEEGKLAVLRAADRTARGRDKQRDRGWGFLNKMGCVEYPTEK